jgi:hypothetical protein
LKKNNFNNNNNNNNNNDEDDDESLIEKAMNCIRAAATNISLFKLNLKTIFQQIDVSNNNFLSKLEMNEAFLHMGVKLDTKSMDAIFKFFKYIFCFILFYICWY